VSVSRLTDFIRERPGTAAACISAVAVLAFGIAASAGIRRTPREHAYIAEARRGDPDAVAAERARLLAALTPRPRPETPPPPPKEAPKEEKEAEKPPAPKHPTRPTLRPPADPPGEPPADLRLSAVLYTTGGAADAERLPTAVPTGWYDAELEGGAAEGTTAVIAGPFGRVEAAPRGAGRARRLLLEVRRLIDPSGRAVPVSGVVVGTDGRPGVPADCHAVSRAAEILALLGAAAAEGTAAAARWAAVGQGLRTGDIGQTLAREGVASGARTAADLFREPLRRGEFCIARPQPVRVFIAPPDRGGRP